MNNLGFLIIVIGFFIIGIGIKKALTQEKINLEIKRKQLLEELSQTPKEEPPVNIEPPRSLIIKNKTYMEIKNLLPYSGFYDETMVYFFQDQFDGRYWFKLSYDTVTKKYSAALHRVDGPAIEYKDGTNHYYILGQSMSRKDFDKFVRDNVTRAYGGLGAY